MLHHVAVTTIMYDDDIRLQLHATDAVRWMAEAVDAHHRGELVAPPRAHTDLGDGRIVFTTGRLRGSWFGYRSYDTLPSDPGSQVVVVHDERSGDVRAIAIGNELGPRRVGAIGAVAADSLAPPAATVAAVIGTGTQARAQVWGLAAVRELTEIRVFSRASSRRATFAQAAQRQIGVACRAAPTARAAIDGADIVVLATSSRVPVIDADWLAPGTYVTTLGPKQQGRAEFGLDLVARASGHRHRLRGPDRRLRSTQHACRHPPPRAARFPRRAPSRRRWAAGTRRGFTLLFRRARRDGGVSPRPSRRVHRRVREARPSTRIGV